MMRAAMAALAALAVCGCGNSETEWLPAGSLAVLVDPHGSPVNLYATSGGGTTPETLSIPSGTAVRVVLDDDSRTGDPDDRMVEVRIAEGARRDAVGFVTRLKVRLTPRR